MTVARATFLSMMMLFTCPSYAQTSLIERVQKSEDSIVTIQAQRLNLDPHIPSGTALSPDGQMVIGTQQHAAVAEQSGAGIIIDPSGYIVTNTHTILYAQFIFATLHNGTRLPARIAAIAPNSDFSILKIDPPSVLRAMPWADSDQVRLGDQVISVGNSPLLKETISGGTIKGIGQSQSGSGGVALIETDLNLYNGDSGGPILDQNGRFLGIVVAKNMKVQHSSFVIPSNIIRREFLTNLAEQPKP
jgi:S1-C subfamily serine protease